MCCRQDTKRLSEDEDDKHKLELDSETAAVVRRIFDMMLAEMGLSDIAGNLNDRYIKCAAVYMHDKGEAVNHVNGFDGLCVTQCLFVLKIVARLWQSATPCGIVMSIIEDNWAIQ